MTYTKKPLYGDESLPRDLSSIEKPAVSVQVLIFSINTNKLEIVLIKRLRAPFKGYWSIPGDIISITESLSEAAGRILYEKTGIRDVYLEQMHTFGDVHRDPRGRVITVTYWALLPYDSVDLSKAPDALNAKWTNIKLLPTLAFDHAEIITTGIARVKDKLLHSNLANALLPEKFRLFDLQKVHEIVLSKQLDKRNFRKKMLSLGLIEPTGEIYTNGNHRPAQLFRFKTKELVMFE